MQDVDYEEIINSKSFSKEDELRYISEYKRTNDLKLRDFIISSNIGLVKYFIKRYTKYNSSDYDDYYQEGCIALMLALDKFDITMGYRFSTYACWYIRQRLQRYRFSVYSAVHIPTHVCEDITKINKIKTQDCLENKNTDLTKALSRDNSYISFISGLQDVVSLNQIVGSDEKDTELGELLPDMISIEKDYELKELRNNIFEIFNILNFDNRTRDIMLKRFGFLDGVAWSLQDIADTYNCSRECIRQVEKKALKRIKGSRVARQLLESYEEVLGC